MTALAGDFDFVCAGIATEIATELLVRRYGAQAWFVSTNFRFLFSHNFTSPLLVIFDRTMHARWVYAFFRSSVALDD